MIFIVSCLGPEKYIRVDGGMADNELLAIYPPFIVFNIQEL